MKGVYKGFEGPNNNGFYTAIIEGQGLPTKFFSHGKKAPKTASGTTVEFDVDERAVGDKVYYSVKGSLREIAGAPAAASSGVTQGGSPRPNDTNASIERQVILKAAVEFVVGTKGDTATPGEVVKAFNAFLPLLQPNAVVPTAPKPKPKPIEEQSQDPDDSDLPY